MSGGAARDVSIGAGNVSVGVGSANCGADGFIKNSEFNNKNFSKYQADRRNMTCIRSCVGCVDSLPFGGVLAGVLVACSGIVTYSGAVTLAPVLDLFAEHLEAGNPGLGQQGLQYVYIVHALILLVAIPVAWRGAVAEARNNGFSSFGFRRCISVGCSACCAPPPASRPSDSRRSPGSASARASSSGRSCIPCCAWLITGVWTLAVTVLLWACVLLAVPVLCIAEAFYLLFGVLFFQACQGYPDSPDHTPETILSTLLAVLEVANEPPLSAGIDFSLDPVTQLKLVNDCCWHKQELRDSTLRILVGGVGLLLAVVLLLTHWAKYSKAWQHATYRNYQVQDAAPARTGPSRRSRTHDYELDEV